MSHFSCAANAGADPPTGLPEVIIGRGVRAEEVRFVEIEGDAVFVDDPRIVLVDADANPAKDLRSWQAVFQRSVRQPLPRHAAVVRSIKAASRSASSTLNSRSRFRSTMRNHFPATQDSLWVDNSAEDRPNRSGIVAATEENGRHPVRIEVIHLGRETPRPSPCRGGNRDCRR